MSTYQFDKLIDRKNTFSVKWDLVDSIYGKKDLLPMWVADMDFEPPKEVKEAILARMEHGIFGYTFTPPATSEVIRDWLKESHGWKINPSWVVYHAGIVPAIATGIQTFTQPGDKVMVHSPVYTPFFDLINKNERVPVFSQLLIDNGRYEIDFADFEKQLQSGVKLFILCNPHNPSGRVWLREELVRIAELCKKYNCLIISDEIHSDLVFKPNRHIPISSIDEGYKDFIITCVAPSKTFNLAGLSASAVIIPNLELRSQFQKAQGKQGLGMLNTFGIIGMEAAYRYGRPWLEALLDYLAGNINLVKQFVGENLPAISVMEPEGTYLVWLNLRGLQLSDEEIKRRLLEKGKLALEFGPKYGQGGEGFVRMNIACPRETLIDGLKRLKKAFE